MSVTDSQAQQLLPIFEMVGPQIVATKCVFIALFTANLYDHILTLPEEIKYIWKRPITPITILFFLNRYYALCVFCVAVAGTYAYISTYVWNYQTRRDRFLLPAIHYRSVCFPCWPKTRQPLTTIPHQTCPSSLSRANLSSCSRFSAFYPFAAGTPLTFFPNIVVGLRVFALYQRRKVVGFFIVTYLTAELAVALWIYSTPGAHPLQLPPGGGSLEALHLCIEQTADSLGNVKSAAFQFMQTIYDTCIFALIIARTAEETRQKRRRQRSVQSIIAAQGLIYYSVIFSANLLWALMIIFAPPGLKYATAMPTLALVCTMVNRMTIDLRLAGKRDLATNWTPPPIPLQNIKAKRFSVSGSTAPIMDISNESSTMDDSMNKEVPSVVRVSVTV